METGIGSAEPEAMDADGLAAFEELRPRLTGLAYRMLGEVQEAEDAVQDAYLRWNGTDRTAVEEPRAWLIKVVTNLCLNRLASARARRETYTGPWLPEPVPGGAGGLGARVLGPLETAEQRDSVSLALLMLMESLTPAERAVYVLREAFGYKHRDIAGVLDVTETASRQLHRRARQRVASAERRFAPPGERWRHLVERFLDAAVRGDLAGLEAVLAEDVVSWSDGGGKVTAARNAVTGRVRMARYIAGLARRALELPAVSVEPSVEDVNGAPGLVVRMDGEVTMVVALEASGDRITAVHAVLNPDKLAFAARALSRSGRLPGPS
ncbi:RNA polymerase sigma-70 factor [Actinomadura napierensis]|uniref:RNA polymerase sigma factor SigJ n=1 Tax=Actinomadura napierensis TaxID=267854 RepID=A0ABN3AI81_9ACTN